jgi:hypothetical protein
MIKGQIFQAKAEKNISATRPMFAFVPEYLIENGKLNSKEYSLRGWDSINCGANKHAIGSHVFPDLTKPITEVPELKKPDFNDFLNSLKRLIQKQKSRLEDFKRPGKPKKEAKCQIPNTQEITQ